MSEIGFFKQHFSCLWPSLSKRLIPPVSEEFITFRNDLAKKQPQLHGEDAGITRFLFAKHNPIRKGVKIYWRCQKEKMRLMGAIHPHFFIHGQKSALFGFWDTLDNLEINREFFAEFENWVRENGVNVICGPINFSTAFSYRLRLDYFDKKPFPGEPQNPEYYNRLLYNLGYNVYEEYTSYLCDNLVAVKKELQQVVSSFIKEYQESYNVVPATPSLLKERGNEIFHLVHGIFSENPAYVPLNKFVFRKYYGERVLQSSCPQVSFLLEDKKKRCFAGLTMNFDGQNYLSKRTLMIKTVGVRKEYRRMGKTFLFIINEVLKRAKAYDSAVFCLMREGNFPSIISREFIKEERKYGLFKKIISNG